MVNEIFFHSQYFKEMKCVHSYYILVREELVNRPSYVLLSLITNANFSSHFKTASSRLITVVPMVLWWGSS